MHKACGLEYETQGEGEPVLLIHGSHVADSFLPLVREAALADRRRLIRYHRRGFAGSERVSGSFRIEDQAQDALAILKHLGVERAHVIGHSYGAVTAIQLALDAPRAVHSLVLLEPPILTPAVAAEFAPRLAPAIDAYRSGDACAAVDAFMREVCGAGWAEETKAIPGVLEQAERDAATFFEVEAPALEGWAFDGERAKRISQPVLYILGGESSAIFEAGMELFEASLPRTERLVLPGLNHLLHVRSPMRVALPIADFLARHPLSAART